MDTTVSGFMYPEATDSIEDYPVDVGQPLAELLETMLGGKTIKRMVYGQFSSAAGITRGTGFTVVHTGTGDYTVTFTTPFANPPTILVLLDGANKVPQLHAVAAGSFEIWIYTANTGANGDCGMTFLAIDT